jgi:hypothetical protein
MIGTTKLSTIREQVRKSFHLTDKELLTWFNRQVEERKHPPVEAKTELETLRLLRDALLREVKRTRPKHKPRRATTGRR